MRLLHITDHTFRETYTPQDVRYSILSHCWSQDPDQPEVTYQAFCSATYDRDGYGWQKIERCCRIPKDRGYDWTWIDTCCIDKTSSAELTETINSMYRWYQDSAECYVFLEDVQAISLPSLSFHDHEQRWKQGLPQDSVIDVEAFVGSRWFTRGWTLQELLAPRDVLFFNNLDMGLGSTRELAALITHAARIDPVYLHNPGQVRAASIAQRMSWASLRATTGSEDMAYALLGIFDINMPLLYGEGGENAFVRLQQEVIGQMDDESIFAWSRPGGAASASGHWYPRDSSESFRKQL